MKHKLNSKVIAAVGISAALTFGLTIALWILSLLGWGIVYIALLLIMIPIVCWLVDVWCETDCCTLEDLWYELTMEDEENKKESSTLDD